MVNEAGIIPVTPQRSRFARFFRRFGKVNESSGTWNHSVALKAVGSAE
jgi:hypothetical protein